MGYLSIDNLYKNQDILLFKECYALEKIHGTSAHIRWNADKKQLSFFSGGEKHDRFVSLFDIDFLKKIFELTFIDSDVVIYGEAYGGKQQGMSKTYGTELKFIAFDVNIRGNWLEVPNAEGLCKEFEIEFVDYVRIPTDLEKINFERDRPSVQALRNGIEGERTREGVVLRPLKEFICKNGQRLISKHKGDDFKETKTAREVSPEQLQVLEDAQAIAEEWVTEMRLNHVLQKLPQDIGIESTKLVIESMVEDVLKESKGEIFPTKEAKSAIGRAAANLFKNKIQKSLK